MTGDVTTDVADGMPGETMPRTPPPLPPRWVDLRPVLLVCTTSWFVGFCVLLVLRYGHHVPTGIWLPTCLAGWLLGLIGTAITYWQRVAARRGSRGAQRVD